MGVCLFTASLLDSLQSSVTSFVLAGAEVGSVPLHQHVNLDLVQVGGRKLRGRGGGLACRVIFVLPIFAPFRSVDACGWSVNLPFRGAYATISTPAPITEFLNGCHESSRDTEESSELIGLITRQGSAG